MLDQEVGYGLGLIHNQKKKKKDFIYTIFHKLRTMKRKPGKGERMEDRKIFIPSVVWLVGKNARK